MKSSIELIVGTLALQPELNLTRSEEIAKDILHVLYKNGFHLTTTKYKDMEDGDAQRS